MLIREARFPVHAPAMATLFMSLVGSMRYAFRTRTELALENLALRQQLANLRRTSARPCLRGIDRAFWLAFSRLWSRLGGCTCHRQARHRRPLAPHWIPPLLALEVLFPYPVQNDVSPEIKALIQQMAEANVTSGTGYRAAEYPIPRRAPCTCASDDSLAKDSSR